MRHCAGKGHNERVDTDEPRGWRQRVREAWRPEPHGEPLTRNAALADLVFATVLTVLALTVAARSGSQDMLGDASFQGPVPPRPPMLPDGVRNVQVQADTVAWPLTVLTTLPLAARRRYPLITFWVVLFAAGAIHTDANLITVVACVVGAYSAMAYSRYRNRALVSLVVAAVLTGLAFADSGPVLPDWSGPFFVLLAAGVLARFVRSSQQRLKASQRRFTELEQAQEEAMRRAVEVERARIAAELHDVVTHNVSVMVIQTGAARKVMDAAPERSKQAMLAVEASGRAAMSELRNVMGLLSASDHERPDGLEPQPGLDQLDSLVDGVRAAGTPVSVAVSPPPDPLPPGIDLTAYRVVQEALTNTLKHAVGASAAVTIGHQDDWLEIEVTDTGGPPGPASRTGNGRGLIGLRERLAVYGGTLESGRRLGGGFRIMARVPWRAAG
jgi:signal transduction histidine kinase